MKQKKILCYSPYNRWEIHGLWESTILKGLLNVGTDIKYILCDAVFSECDIFPKSENPRVESSCSDCIKFVTNFVGQNDIPFEWFSRYLTEEDYRIATEWANSVPNDDLLTAEYKGWEISKWVIGSVHTYFRISYIDISDAEIAKVVRNYLYSGLIACIGLDRIFESYKPDLLFLFNGRLSSTRIALELAKRKNIKVITHERGYLKESLLLKENVTCIDLKQTRESWQHWGSVPLTKEELFTISNFLNDREYGNNLNWYQFSPKLQTIEKIRKQLSIPNNKLVWVLFTSSDDEVISDPDWKSCFTTQMDWILSTVHFVSIHKNIELIIRIHPNTAGKYASGNNFKQLSELQELNQRLPDNIKMIMPEEEVSSYTLMELSTVGLAFQSTVGLEMACKGKHVIMTTLRFLGDPAFVTTINFKDEYYSALEDALNIPIGYIDIKKQIYAYRYAYLLFFRIPIPFPLIKMNDPIHAYRAYNSNDDLMPNKDIYLDRIIDIILNNQPVCALPNKLELERNSMEEDSFFNLLTETNKMTQTSKQTIKKISVIIPTYNREELLGITIESFVKQNYPKQYFEIIIADNNSNDDTKKVVEKWQKESDVNIIYLFEPRQGVHYARNSAARISSGEILYYTDDDMIADRNLLSEIIKPFQENDKVASVTGKVLPKWEVEPPQWLLECCNNGYLSLNDKGDGLFISDDDPGVWSCHQAISREAFFKSEGFNPENTAGIWIGDGETGLNLKIKKLGYKFAYNGKSITYHIIPSSRMTQEYLNKRLANQGYCDSYTGYRDIKDNEFDLLKNMNTYGDNIIKELQNYLIKRNIKDNQWHIHLAKIFYNLSRIDFDFKLVEDEKWKALVLKNDWLSNDTIEINDNQTIKSTENHLDDIADKPLQSQFQKSKNMPLIINQLIENNIQVEKHEVDVNDFANWLNEYPKMLNYYMHLKDVVIEKCLEHYLAHRVLNISYNDLYIDVACANSIFADCLREKGVKAYKLDSVHPLGINGITIGGDASNIPFGDESVTSMSLQCAFECFEGNSDTDFIIEAKRVLKKGGKLLITPLYMNNQHINIICEQKDKRHIPLDPGALKVWRDDEYDAPFDREYSVASLTERILNKLGNGFSYKIIHLTNLLNMMKIFNGQRIYCDISLYIEKNKN